MDDDDSDLLALMETSVTEGPGEGEGGGEGHQDPKEKIAAMVKNLVGLENLAAGIIEPDVVPLEGQRFYEELVSLKVNYLGLS